MNRHVKSKHAGETEDGSREPVGPVVVDIPAQGEHESLCYVNTFSECVPRTFDEILSNYFSVDLFSNPLSPFYPVQRWLDLRVTSVTIATRVM